LVVEDAQAFLPVSLTAADGKCIGYIAGIDVYMHIAFLLLISWVALLHRRQGQSITAAVAGVLLH
jgi:hypothetical protein